MTLTTSRLKAVVDKRSGRVTFTDTEGKVILGEAAEGKRFWEYRVPDREIGVDLAKVSEQQRKGLTWQMVFDSPDDEAFYGLGQHQSEELNMKGKNEDLFQYNTKVSVPFVISNRNYGILWDSYSYCRFGMPYDYQQLCEAFRLYDRNGREGHLTGTYTDRQGRQIVREEDSIYYEYACPETSQLAAKVDKGGTRNLPKGFALDGANVVYEGFIEACQDDDRCLVIDTRFVRTQTAKCFHAIHIRHQVIHKDQIIVIIYTFFQAFDAIIRDIDLHKCLFQQ